MNDISPTALGYHAAFRWTSLNAASRWLLILIVASGSVAIAFASVLMARGMHPVQAVMSTAPGQTINLVRPIGNDSWKPMARADKRFEESTDRDLYAIFLQDHIKFQYPPSALLVLHLFPQRLFTGPDSLDKGLPMNRVLTGATLVGVIVTVLLSTLIFVRSAERAGYVSRALDRWIIAVCGGLLGLTFYPLVRGFALGQIQVFLDALIAAGLLAYLYGWKGLAGACIGLCCLVKPQYAIVLMWAVWRREWRFAGWCIGIGAVGLMLSVLQFGFDNHLRYLDVLRVIASRGEVYWPNQSVNGLLNRFLENGDPSKFDRYSFPAYHPVVYYGTLLSSLALVVAALWAPRDSDERYRAVDLALAVVVATMAAPVAWEHHYGTFLPLFALVAPLVMQAHRRAGTAALLMLSYLLVASAFLAPQWLLASRWMAISTSYLFFGALLLFFLLVRTRVALRSSANTVV